MKKCAVICVAAAIVISCGGDDSTPARPQPPPELSISGLQPVGGPAWKPGDAACVEVGRDPNQTIAVLLSVNNFVFRPPGACGTARQCGTAVVRIDPSGHTFQAAAPTVDVAFNDQGL